MIAVTSLADDGPGTLRAALSDSSPRIIVFRVSGTIELRSERQIGLDPNDAADGRDDLDGDGYTNIEEYLHLLSDRR